jgi:hypothetical protein
MVSDEKLNEIGAELGITEMISPLQELPEGYHWEMEWDVCHDSLHLRLMKITKTVRKFGKSTHESVLSCCVDYPASGREMGWLMAESVKKSKKLWNDHKGRDPEKIAEKAAELSRLLGVKVTVE